MIFLSYSRKDDSFYREFAEHLEVMKSELDVWSDQRLRAGDDWEREIESALAETDLAVLLISSSFLTSPFIAERELPPLLRAASQQRLLLTWLSVRHCNLEKPIEIDGLSDMRLDSFQGLNDPKTPLAAMTRSDRDRVYSEAVRSLRSLLSRPQGIGFPSKRRYGRRRDLTVKLSVQGKWLVRTFFYGYSQLREGGDSWPTISREIARFRQPGAILSDQDGDFLYRILFGEGKQESAVLQAVYESSTKNQSPIRHPVRVRIFCEEASLTQLPWTRTAWQGHPLSEEGWTFELLTPDLADKLDRLPSLPEGFLKAPCPLIIAAPEPAGHSHLHGEAHFRAVRHRFEHCWTALAEKQPRGLTCQDIQDRFEKRQVGILYFYGQARWKPELQILFEDGKGGVDAVPLSSLPSLWNDRPPQLVALHLVTDVPSAPGDALLPLAESAEAVIAQAGKDRFQVTEAALQWLRGFLEGGSGADPIEVAHQFLPATTTVYGHYGRWHTRVTGSPHIREHPRITLDRVSQRSRVLHLVNEMARDDFKRHVCALGFGSQDDQPKLVFDQIWDYLRDNSRHLALFRERLALPPADRFQAAEIEQALRQSWALGSREPLGPALARLTEGRMGRSTPLLLLDWGVRGGGAGRHGPISVGGLQAWIQFCLETLLAAQREVPNLRILSLFALEVDRDRQPDLIKLTTKIREDRRFIDRSFQVEVLDALGEVNMADLVTYLERSEYACPDDLVLELAALIVRRTKGHFTETYRWLERGIDVGWHVILDRLSEEDDRPSAAMGGLAEKEEEEVF